MRNIVLFYAVVAIGKNIALTALENPVTRAQVNRYSQLTRCNTLLSNVCLHSLGFISGGHGAEIPSFVLYS